MLQPKFNGGIMIKQRVSLRTIGSAIMLATVFGLPVNQAKAQGAEVEEVVVTARRREESLQEVPDAVTAFTAANIENYGIESYEDFLALVPNLSFRAGNALR